MTKKPATRYVAALLSFLLVIVLSKIPYFVEHSLDDDQLSFGLGLFALYGIGPGALITLLGMVLVNLYKQ